MPVIEVESSDEQDQGCGGPQLPGRAPEAAPLKTGSDEGASGRTRSSGQTSWYNLDTGVASEASSLLASPTRVCDFRILCHSKCGRLPEYADPVLEECRVESESGEAIEQRGQWWCFEHAKVVLTNLRPGSLSNRRKEQWEEAVRNATRLIGDRDDDERRFEEATRRDGHIVELLESGLAEERYQRQCAAMIQREHEAAAVAAVRGSRIVERESVERAAEQVAIEAVAAARAQVREQEAAWRAEEEDQVAKNSRRRAEFFEEQSRSSRTFTWGA